MICEKCHGTGVESHRSPDSIVNVPCPDCGGSGIVSCCDPARGQEIGAEDWGGLKEGVFPEDATTDILNYGMTIRKITFEAGKMVAERIPPEKLDERAKSSYIDDSYPERLCDFCGGLYRGPAVYCSLWCALRDA